MAELDSLEIRISADASNAAENVNSLADALDKLGNTANIGIPLSEAARGITEIKNAVKGIKDMSGTVSTLQRNLDALSGIKAPEGLQNLSASLKPLNDLTKTLSDFTRTANIGNFTKQLLQLEAGIEALSNMEIGDTSKLTHFFDSLSNINVNTESIKAMRTISNTVRNISAVQPNENAAEAVRAFVDAVREIEDDDIQRLRDLASASKAFFNQSEEQDSSKSVSPIPDDLIDSMRRYYNAAKDAGEESSKANPKISEFRESFKEFAEGFKNFSVKAFTGTIKAIASPITKIGSTFKSVAKKAAEFLSSLKRIAMYRAIRTALKAVSEGFAEGRKNLYYYSQAVGTDFAPTMDKAATAALYLKNSIGAATAPLTNYLVPIIDKAVDRIVEMINRFNELTAVLTGASSWTRAVKYPTTWQEELDDADKSAKKLKSTMLGFDELNVIEPPTTGAKTKLDDALDYSKMFEEVRTDMTLKGGLPDLLIPVKMAWDAEGDNTIQEIKRTWREILGLIGSVSESFRTVWENGTGQQTLEIILQITQEIVGTFGALAKNIKKAWNEGGKGTHIIQNVWNVANNLLTVFRDIWSSIREWAEGLDWNPLLSSLESLSNTLDEITNPNSAIMKGLKAIVTEILEPIGKWLVEEGLPAGIGLLETSLKGLNSLAETLDLENIVTWLGKIASLTFSNISGLVSGINALAAISNGEAVSDTDVANLEKSNQRLIDFFGGEDSPYATINKEIQNKGLFGFGQALGEYMFDRDQERFYGGFDDDGLTFANTGFKGFNSEAERLLFKSENTDDIEKANFFKDFGENIKNFWTETASQVESSPLIQFFKDLYDSTQDIGVWFYEFTHETWPQFWENVGGKLFDWVEGFKNSWSSGWDMIKKKAKDTWDAVKKFLSDGWDNIKSKVTDFVDNWKSGFNDVKQWAVDTWDNVTAKAEEMKNNLVGKWDSIKTTVKTKFDGIKSSITNAFGNAWIEVQKGVGSFISTITKSFGNLWDNGQGGGIWGHLSGLGTNIYNKFTEIKDNIVGIFNTLNEQLKSPINSIIGNVETFINTWIIGLNDLLDRLHFLGNSHAAAAFEKATGISLNWSVSLNEISLPRLENGGIPANGQLFIANEAGPELVGRFGNQTGVMNNAQIVEAVSNGVYRAVSQAMAQHNNSERPIQNHIYLDRKELTSQVNQQQKANGVSIMSELVYT